MTTDGTSNAQHDNAGAPNSPSQEASGTEIGHGAKEVLPSAAAAIPDLDGVDESLFLDEDFPDDVELS